MLQGNDSSESLSTSAATSNRFASSVITEAVKPPGQ